MSLSWRGLRRLAACVALSAPLAVGATSPQTTFSSGDAQRHHVQRVTTPQRSTSHPSGVSAPLVFGVYPGGAAGTVGPAGQTRPEVPEARTQALRQLRGSGRPFVLHLYESYTQPSDAAAIPAWLASQIADYTADDFQIELVLAYRPSDPAGDVAGFTDFVRARVQQLAPNPGVTFLQVTNEANVAGAPDAADGAYRGAREALVRGVIAAKDEARRTGRAGLRIGFNWAYQGGAAEAAFFSSLRAAGGSALAGAVDWVGIDAYPGTWGPALAAGDPAAAVRSATLDAMRTLRSKLLPRAGLSRARLHFSESGYPTGPGRSESMQRTVLRAAVQTVAAARTTYGVTDYRWFDLRDADTTDASFESHYGLTRDDYSPKPAFFTYRDLIARLG
ncbi:MAG: hypothetical protein QOF86_2827 [Baekduia sp.]|nr:hypothetical protein [Baekduia sp.]